MTAMLWRYMAALSLAGALAGCGSLATRQAAPSTPVHSTTEPAVETARLAVLDTVPAWAFRGRVAISEGRNGGNGRIDWQQRGDAYQVSLAAPVTRQSWQLSGGAGQAVRLEGLPPRAGERDLPRWSLRNSPAEGNNKPAGTRNNTGSHNSRAQRAIRARWSPAASPRPRQSPRPPRHGAARQ